MFAAGGRAICLVDENVIVATGADDAVNRFVELFVTRHFGGVFVAGLFTAHGHVFYSFLVTASNLAIP